MEMEREEDVTRGRGMAEPTSYKGDALVQSWVDSRYLAVLSNWLESQDARPRYMSEVVNWTIEAVVDSLVEQGKVKMVEDTVEAREMLIEKYRVNLNPSGRGLKNALHNTVLSSNRGYDKGGRGRKDEKKIEDMVSIYQSLESEEFLEKQRRKKEEMEEGFRKGPDESKIVE